MEITPIVVGQLATNSYILHDSLGNGIIIDPGAESDTIMSYIEDKNIDVIKIVLTHGHYDHIGAVLDIVNKTGAKILIHKEDEKMLKSGRLNLSYMLGEDCSLAGADRLLEEGDIIKIGHKSLKVIHTPGHTEGGISLVLENRAIFTGDTLFRGSIGRTDFPGGDYNTLIDSIMKKIMVLDDSLILYSGHGPQSTIGHERLHNPYIDR
ncbi:MAG: MBL fold metallo-hydrolase [Clostridiales bacterium]|mgnify:CR=1 FL=1|nr:MBL fold metallo-hydrolase [Clostridiales bacterium]